MFASNTTQAIIFGRGYYGTNQSTPRVQQDLFTNNKGIPTTQIKAQFREPQNALNLTIPGSFARTNFFDSDGNAKYVYEVSYKVTQSKFTLSLDIEI